MQRYAAIIVLCSGLLLAACGPRLQDPPPPPLPSPTIIEADRWRVQRVVDGDTIVVEQGGREEKVRLLGVNTPETVDPRRPVEEYGAEASAYLHRLLDGATVRLEHPSGSDTRDHFDRLLAYVYRESDELLVNLEIVRQGYGHALTEYPFEGLEQFIAAEREAREARRGLWADAAPETGPLVMVAPTGQRYHRPECGEVGEQGEAMGLSRAVSEGYQPCGLCEPPVAPQPAVSQPATAPAP